MAYHDRPTADEHAPHYGEYISRLPDGDIIEILRRGAEETHGFLGDLSPEEAEHAYAPGKWTVKEVVGHLVDVERLMNARAVRVARGDETPIPGFDEDAYVENAGFGDRTLDDLLEELRAVRRSTVALFDGLPPEAWTRRGTASGHSVTVRAIACIIAGHELHHRALLRERYGIGAPAGG